MIVLYDTSALISLYLENHPKHGESARAFNTLKNDGADFYMCAHSIAEIYSNVTKGLLYLDLSPSKANDLVKDEVTNDFAVIELSKSDYLSTTKFLAENKLTGGIIYDGIIAKASKKISAEYIVTADEGDFLTIGGLTDANFIIPS